MMNRSRYSIFCVLLCFNLFCSATKILPRAPHPLIESPAPVELHNVNISLQDGLDVLSGLLPRMRYPASPPQERIFNNSSFAITKRSFLGIRQSCDPGYNLCPVDNRCCPNSGSGACCDDGSCVSGNETCCATGGSCPSGQDCCLQGCKPQEDTCCTDNWTCPPGTFCCGDQNCAVNGGECCQGRTSCDDGLHCVVLNGKEGCCADYDCTSFSAGGPAPGPISEPSATFTPISITPLSLPSITPITLPSVTVPSITPITFPSVTAPSITDLAANYVYYTTTFTWYYYSYYITTIAPTRVPTSVRTSTTQIISVYATNTADAASQFASISSAVGAGVPSAVTAPEYTNSLAKPTFTAGSGNSLSAPAGVPASKSAKGMEMGMKGVCGGLGGGCLVVLVTAAVLLVWL